PITTLSHINTYLVKGDNGYLLVDTGWNTEEAFASLKKQLAEIGISGQDISRIVVTHTHPDHYGMAGKLRPLFSATLYFHHLEKDVIESRYVNMDELLKELSQWLHINGVPPDRLAELQKASLPMLKFVTPTMPDITLYGGETITIGDFSFNVLPTPGHAPGHICLYEPDKKILFSGDHVLPTITPNVGMHPQSGSNPLGDYLDSINSLKRLDVDLVLPGHEQPFTGFQERIESITLHHSLRNAEIVAALGYASKTAFQLTTEITWLHDVNGVGWYKLGTWDKRMAILETLAHLEAMRAKGELEKFTREDILYYRLPKKAKTSE
ncbi:MAG: MBL fold metallo-hydrolase, partial [Deltaproteobacteria bacterium]|nr:MBL fold metallo-hydrolase [Deltaproteobacteria bacterium]